MGKLYSYIRPYIGYICLTIFIKLCGAVTELMIPWLMELILDDVVPAGQRNLIFLYGGGMILCAGCRSGRRSCRPFRRRTFRWTKKSGFALWSAANLSNSVAFIFLLLYNIACSDRAISALFGIRMRALCDSDP